MSSFSRKVAWISAKQMLPAFGVTSSSRVSGLRLQINECQMLTSPLGVYCMLAARCKLALDWQAEVRSPRNPPFSHKALLTWFHKMGTSKQYDQLSMLELVWVESKTRWRTTDFKYYNIARRYPHGPYSHCNKHSQTNSHCCFYSIETPLYLRYSWARSTNQIFSREFGVFRYTVPNLCDF